ncbi:MAG: hypothetical protein U0R69_13280 [Gaiellales bacterium]
MDEAHRVIERLERIEAMKASAVPAGELLTELRSLLRDGQAWLASEGVRGTAGAAAALDRLAHVLEPRTDGLHGKEVVAKARDCSRDT